RRVNEVSGQRTETAKESGRRSYAVAGVAEKFRRWRTDYLGVLVLLRASYVSFVFTPHAHEGFLVALTDEGVGYPIFRHDRHPVRPGDLFVLNPEESHAGGSATDAPWGDRAIYPSAELLSRISAELAGRRARVP